MDCGETVKLFCSTNKLVEASPEIQRELKQELEKIAKQYGGDGQDLTKFPTFQFQDPVIDPIREKWTQWVCRFLILSCISNKTTCSYSHSVLNIEIPPTHELN